MNKDIKFTFSDLMAQRLLIGCFSKCRYATRFIFEFEDFVDLHALIAENFQEVDAKLDKFAKAINEKEAPLGDEEEREINRIYESRMRDQIFSTDQKNRRILHYSSSLAVVGLWSMCEKNIVRAFKHIHALKGITIQENEIPDRWDEYKRSFRGLGFPLNDLLHFDDVNECRILNNSLKHSEVVEQELGAFKSFRGLLGKDLSSITFDVKRYAVGVHNFIQDLYEKIDPI